jgi:fumarate hydratase subunit beta
LGIFHKLFCIFYRGSWIAYLASYTASCILYPGGGLPLKNAIPIKTPLTDETCRVLSAGDRVLLSGTVYTARDVAHRRLVEAARKGEKFPVDLKGQILYYAAPSPAKPGRVIGSLGPTTSSRMDPFTPELLRMGLKGMIGKGRRSPEVIVAMRESGALYFGAPGGVAALLAGCVRKAEPAAYGDLGPEAMLRLELFEMPLVVLIDSRGRDLYEDVLKNGKFPGKKAK